MATTADLPVIANPADVNRSGKQALLVADYAARTPGTAVSLALSDASIFPDGAWLSVVDKDSDLAKDLVCDYTVSGRLLLSAVSTTGVAYSAGDKVVLGVPAELIEGMIDVMATLEAVAAAAAQEADLQTRVPAIVVANANEASPGLLLDVEPPMRIDGNGDLLPRVYPGGEFFKQASGDKCITFDLSNGQIDGGAPAGDWENEFPVSLASQAIGRLCYRASDGIFQLVKGDEQANTTIQTTDHSVAGNTIAADPLIALWGVYQNLTGQVLTITGITGFGGTNGDYYLANKTTKARVVAWTCADYTGDPASGAEIAATSNPWYTHVQGGSGGTAQFDLSCQIDVPVGAFFRVGVEYDIVAAQVQRKEGGIAAQTETNGAAVTVVDYQGLFKGTRGAFTFDSVDCAIHGNITYTTGSLSRPDAPAGFGTVALVGTPNYPITRGTTTKLVWRTMTEMAADSFADDPASDEAPFGFDSEAV